jgi:hypothetical protein
VEALLSHVCGERIATLCSYREHSYPASWILMDDCEEMLALHQLLLLALPLA